MRQLGNDEQLRTEADELLRALDDPALAGDGNPRVNRQSVRIEVLELAADAARRNRSGHEAQLRRRILDETIAAGGAERDLARAQFNLLSMRLRDGSWDGDTEDLLLAARTQFCNPAVIMDLARLERHRGNFPDAVELARQALRAHYAANTCLGAAADHHTLATMLASAGHRAGAQEAPVHLLASAVIQTRVSEGTFTFTTQPAVMKALAMLTLYLARNPYPILASFPELCQHLQNDLGVDLAALLAHTPRVPIVIDPNSGQLTLKISGEEGVEGDSVTDVLCWAKHHPPPTELLDVERHPRHWVEIVETVADAARRNRPAESASIIDDLRVAGWAALAEAFIGVLAGARSTVLTGLDHTDSAIVRRTLTLLS